MRFAPSPEQAAFAAALHDLLPPPARSRCVGHRLAEMGVTGLAVPSRWGGADGTPADLVIAAEELGHHAVAGPVAESLAAVPALLAGLGDDALCDKWLPELAAGRATASLAAPPWLPLADGGRPGPARRRRHGVAGPHRRRACVPGRHPAAGRGHPGRRAARVRPLDASGSPPGRSTSAYWPARRNCSAPAGRCWRWPSDTRGSGSQFGKPIGSFQAIQHRLADVAVGLEFARPLLYAAAATDAAPLDVSAAKVACGDAAHRAARAALQVHGAIGYTREHGLGRWLTKVRVLTLAWGTPGQHRARVMAELR